MISPTGILFDLDGVIYQDDELINGAKETLSLLSKNNIPYKFISNTSTLSIDQIVNKLFNMNIKIHKNQIVSVSVAAIEYCNKMNYNKINLIVSNKKIKDDFKHLNLVKNNSDAIILGDLGHDFTYDVLNDIFSEIINGSKLIALHKNRFWRSNNKLKIDLGAFIAAIEYATNTTAAVIGKPNSNIFKMAINNWKQNINSIYVIGDDIESDIIGAKNAGMRSILVKTGKFNQEILNKSKIKPDNIIPSVAYLKNIIKLN
tara:strand:+ start:159 stop:935 length:777 start_codon:yes stop_codon:yes gene_type:complete